jgi:hypothetical protein
MRRLGCCDRCTFSRSAQWAYVCARAELRPHGLNRGDVEEPLPDVFVTVVLTLLSARGVSFHFRRYTSAFCSARAKQYNRKSVHCGRESRTVVAMHWCGGGGDVGAVVAYAFTQPKSLYSSYT